VRKIQIIPPGLEAGNFREAGWHWHSGLPLAAAVTIWVIMYLPWELAANKQKPMNPSF